MEKQATGTYVVSGSPHWSWGQSAPDIAHHPKRDCTVRTNPTGLETLPYDLQVWLQYYDGRMNIPLP
jgi:hypothetical protein